MRRRRIRVARLAWVAVAAVVLVAAAGTAVLAQSDETSPESGPPNQIRYASPRRTSPPQIVARGATEAGRPYVLRTSRAGKQLCLEVEYEPYGAGTGDVDAEGHQAAIATLKTSEVCVDPAQHPISASIGQLFVDPDTGQITKRPQRFVYGVVTGEANSVRLHSPGANARDLELTAVAGTDVKVFAGSAPRDADPGEGRVVATARADNEIADYPLTFVGPGR